MYTKKGVLVFIIGLLANFCNAQCVYAPNIGFETAGTTGWNFNIGNHTVSGTSALLSWTGTIIPPVFNSAQLMTGPGMDPLAPAIPVVCPTTMIPGNTTSLKLGGTAGFGQADRATYNVTVPPGVPYVVINYHFAVLMQNVSGHSAAEQPFFQVSLKNAATGTLPCSVINFNAGTLPGGFAISPIAPLPGLPPTSYSNWQSASLVIPYSTSPYTIEFAVTGCSFVQHWGYAYIDVGCSEFPTTIKPCKTAASSTFSLPIAPPGFSTYQWFSLPSWTSIGTVSAGAALSGLSFPPGPASYALIMTPFPGLGCVETLQVHVDPQYSPVAGTINPLVLCVGDSGPISFTGTTTPGGTWSGWNPAVISIDPDGTIHAVGVGSTTFTYTVTNPCGTATAVGSVTVHPLPPAPTITETTGRHCEGDMLRFCVTGMAGAPIIYSYSGGGPAPATSHFATLSGIPGSAIPGTFCFTLTAVAPSVSFWVEAITNPITGCTNWTSLEKNVCVAPHPVAGAISGPNPLCAGTAGTYTTSGTPGGTWSVSGLGTISSASANTAIFTPYDWSTGTATITYSFTNCCGSVLTTFNVTVKTLPVNPTVIYTGCMVPCPGTPLTFAVHGTPNSFIVWEWTDPTGPVTPGVDVLLDGSGDGIITIPAPAALGVGPGLALITVLGAYLDGCHNFLGVDHPFFVAWPTAEILQVDREDICIGSCANILIKGYPGRNIFLTAMPGGTTHTVTAGPTGTAVFTVCPTVTTTYQITGVEGPCCTHMYPGPSATINVFTYPITTLTHTPPICEGSPLVLTATSSSSAPFYGWTLVGGITFSTLLPTYTVTMNATAAHSGVYMVESFNGPCSTTATTTVNVVPRPFVHSIVYTGCMIPCPGTPLTFAVNGTPGAQVHWEWTDPSGLVTPGTPVLLDALGNGVISIPGGALTPSGTGLFYVTTLGVSIGGCYYNIGMDYPLAIAWPTAEILQVDREDICIGSCATILIKGYPGRDVFLTAMPGGTTHTVTAGPGGTAVFTVCPTVTTTYQITGVEGPCCTHMYPGASVTINVFTHPVTTLTHAPPICEGSPLVLTATSSSSAPFYGWTLVGGITFSTLLPTYTVTMNATAAHSGVYTVESFNGPCSTTATTTVNVVPRPFVHSIVYTGCMTPCPGTPLTFAVNGTPGAQVHWEWTDPSGLVTPGTPVLLDALGNGVISIPGGALTPSGTGLFYVTTLGVSIGGCYYNIGMATPLAIAWPAASILQVNSTEICKGDCAEIPIKGYPGFPAKNVYLTAVPGGMTYTVPMNPVTGMAIFTVCPTVTTTYQITGVDGPCCTHMYTGASITITVMSPPLVTLSPSIVCAGHPLILTAWSSSPIPYFGWTLPGGITYGAGPTYTVTPTAYPVHGGVYSVESSDGPCRATATITVTVVPLPTASMWCESKCGEGGSTVAILHFTATPLCTLYVNTIPSSGPDILVFVDAGGNATLTVPISGTTSFVINDIETVEGCHLYTSIVGCTITPDVPAPPTVTCWSYYDETGFHLGFSCASATPSSPVRVYFTGYASGTFGSCSLSTYVDLTGPSVEITACMLVSLGCTLPGPCSAATVSAIYTSSIEYLGCKWQHNCSKVISKPGRNIAEDSEMQNSGNSGPGISIMPNPNKGMFTVSGNIPGMKDGTELQVEVTDVLGKTVFAGTSVVANEMMQAKVVVADNVANGVYLLRVKNNGINQVVRFTLDR